MQSSKGGSSLDCFLIRLYLGEEGRRFLTNRILCSNLLVTVLDETRNDFAFKALRQCVNIDCYLIWHKMPAHLFAALFMPKTGQQKTRLAGWVRVVIYPLNKARSERNVLFNQKYYATALHNR